jgi:nicotinamide-nucleotide amidase
MRVAILSIGYELLIGKVVNTNASWLCAELTKRGHTIERITCIGDDEQEISSEVKASLSRRLDALVTTGGLGPTFDDITARSIAKGLDRQCVVNHEALKMVQNKYESLGLPLTPERVKMAELPMGSVVLRNPVGTAPGFALTQEKTLIIGFPGVPLEMKEMFRETMDRFFPVAGDFVEESIFVKDLPESTVAPMVEGVVKKNPFVYIKTHPKNSEGASFLEVHIYTRSSDPLVKNHLVRVSEELKAELLKAGGKLR